MDLQGRALLPLPEVTRGYTKQSFTMNVSAVTDVIVKQ